VGCREVDGLVVETLGYNRSSPADEMEGEKRKVVSAMRRGFP
jgi:hypothetical protein